MSCLKLGDIFEKTNYYFKNWVKQGNKETKKTAI